MNVRSTCGTLHPCHHHRPRRLQAGALSLAVLSALAWSSPTYATDRTWSDAFADGLWSTPGNWSPSGTPATGDNLTIAGSNVITQLVTYDYTGAPVTINSLTISRPNPNFATMNDPQLTMTANTLTVTSEIIGTSAVSGGIHVRGHFVQSGGTHLVSSLTMGQLAGDSGTYNLSGSGSLSVTNLFIGAAGGATFTQGGGDLTFNGMTLGSAAGAIGNFNLSGGLLHSPSASEIIGNSGTGNFTQTGGTHYLTGFPSYFYMGYAAAGVGTYSISGGSLGFAPASYIGFNGTGSITQTAGNVGAVFTNSNIYMANATGSSAIYALSGTGAMNFFAAQFVVGVAGNATFTQTGGTHINNNPGTSVSNTPLLIIASASTSTSAYNLSAGTLALTNGQAYVGNDGNGSFNQDGGLFSMDLPAPGQAALIVAQGTGSTGVYNLSGGSLTINNGAMFVGYSGAGTFNQTAGNLTLVSSTGASALIELGSFPGSTGVFNLSGGSVTATNLFMGTQGTGTFNHFSGVFTLTGAATFSIIQGSYTLSGGILSDIEGQQFLDGSATTTATFLQTGGTNTLTGSFFGTLNIGRTAGGSGIYTLNGGNLNTRAIYIAGSSSGPGGAGTLTMNTLNTLAAPSGITVYPMGLLNGSGSTAASVNLLGGALSPGNPVGTLTIGPLSTSANASVVLDTKDLVASSGALTITGPTTILLRGPFSTPVPLITYGTSLTGQTSNISIVGGRVDLAYTSVNDAPNHALTFSTKPSNRHLQISTVGQAADGGDTFSQSLVTYPALNAAGQVAFASNMFSLTGSPSGVFRGDGTTITTIARQNQAAPGAGGGIFSSFGITGDGPALNASGQVAFLAGLSGTINGGTAGIFRGDGTTLIPIAREFQSIPGGGGAFIDQIVNQINLSIPTPMSRLNAAGQVAFVAHVSGVVPAYTGILLGDGTTMTTIVKSGQAAPVVGGGTSGTFSTVFGFENGVYQAPAINNSGQVAFISLINGSTSTVGIFRGDGASLTPIARQGQNVPPDAAGGQFGYFFNDFDTPAFNDAGMVAFNNLNLTGTTDGATQAIFRWDGTTTLFIARDNRAAPGPGGGIFGSPSPVTHFSAPSMNAAGQVAFSAYITGTSDGSNNGIFRGDGSSLIAIARALQVAPGSGGAVFANFAGSGPSRVAIAPGGQVAFVTTLSNAPGLAPFTSGLYLGDGQELVKAGITGQTVITSQGPRTISAFVLDSGEVGQNPINAFGQVAYMAFYAEGGSGNFLFTPTLHWRNPASGSWNTSTNWTLSLAPASVHDVVIDPPTSLTITGPSIPTTVKSLTIGGNAGTLTLQLAAGSLKVPTAGFAIAGAASAWTGRLDLAAGALVLQASSPAEKNSAIATLQNQILSGKNSGTWNGTGITSSLIPGTPNTSLALADNADLHLTTFRGQSLNDNALILVQAHNGDANLDGKVDAFDLNLLAAHWQQTSGALWSAGDFNGDQKVDAFDLNLLAANWQFGTALQGTLEAAQSLQAALAQLPFLTGQSQSAAPVPEPASLLLLAPLLIIRRRRRRSNFPTRAPTQP